MSDCCANPDVKKKKKPGYLERMLLKIVAIIVVIGILIFACFFWVGLVTLSIGFLLVLFGYYFVGKIRRRKL